jgi:GNAT superfamily N-acetyltransferase
MLRRARQPAEVVTTVGVRIDELTSRDGRRLQSIRLRALADAPDAFGTTLEHALALSEDAWSRQVRELPTLIAVRDGRDVGMVRCARDQTTNDTAWLISMWVAPEARRSGVGSALVDRVVEWARTNGIRRLLLDVADGNAEAIALYQRKGFEPTGEAGALPAPRQHITEHRRELRLPVGGPILV